MKGTNTHAVKWTQYELDGWRYNSSKKVTLALVVPDFTYKKTNEKTNFKIRMTNCFKDRTNLDLSAWQKVAWLVERQRKI